MRVVVRAFFVRLTRFANRYPIAVGVYGFVFYRGGCFNHHFACNRFLRTENFLDGEWISSIIDDKLYLTKPDHDQQSDVRMEWDDMNRRVDGEEEYRKAYQTGSIALYFGQCSDQNETWVPLMEKAYAKAHGDYSSIDGGYPG